MRQQGKLTDWYDERGYGWVIRHGDNKRVYVHISELVEGQRRPRQGDALIYDVIPGKGGSLAAINIILPETNSKLAIHSRIGKRLDTQAYVLATFVLAILFLLAVMGKLSWYVFGWYLLVSAIAWATYGADKRAALAKQRRIPEDQLHLASLLGGWPGALAAQRRFRHKSAKRSFQAMFWLTVLVNVAVLVMALMPMGQRWLAVIGF